MSGKPIDIPIKIDADADKGASEITDALSNIEDSLKDVDKASDKTSKALEDDFEDAGKKIDRDLTKALKEVKDESKSTGKAIGKNVKDGTDKAGEGLGELKDESKSTAKEAAASFGSIEDSIDALQEVAANAFVGFGPAGMAAGLIAAVGIGLAVSALQDNADKINENKDKMLDLAKTIKDNGGALREADYIQSMEDYGFAIQDTKEWFEIFQKDAVSGFEELRNQSDKTGVSLGDIFKGRFGSLQDAQKVYGQLQNKLKDLQSQTRGNALTEAEFGGSFDNSNVAILEQLKHTQGLSDKVRDHIQQLEDANEIERIRKESIKNTTQATLEDVAAIEKRTDAVKNSINTELDSIEATQAVTESIQTNGATLDKNTESGRANIRAILDAASSYEEQARASLEAGESTDSVTAKFEAQKNTLITQVMPAFGNSRAAAENYINTILRTPPTVNTRVNITGLPQAEAELRNFTSAGRHLYIDVHGNTQSVQNSIAALNGTRISVDVAPRLGVGITN
jgi:hypothetical protein